MKKILFITPFTPDDHGGGGTSYTKCLLAELSKKSRIDLIYFRYANKGYYESLSPNLSIVKEYTISKVDKIFSLLNVPWVFPLFSARFRWSIRNEIQRIIDRGGYDLVYFDFGQTFTYAKYLKHPNKLLMAHDVIGQKYSRSKKYLYRWARLSEKSMLKSANAIFTFSEKDCALYRDWYGVNCMPTTFFLNDNVQKATPQGSGDYFVMFGSWKRYENYGALEWLMDNVSEKLNKDIRIKIVGGGKMPDEIMDRVQKSEFFEYVGFLDNPYDIIANAKAEIAPLTKGAGVKVKCVEALACGTPVIGSDVAFEGISTVFCDFMLYANTPDDYARLINTINTPIPQRLSFKKFFTTHYNEKNVLKYIYN
ncbi:MAG: glycosyltransferase [Paludibacteraceae bacterium]|nr:glycosyltransferase [Paludibacteraceae bacterium]